MIVGIITGTYSSVFIAAAIVSFWRGSARRRTRRRRRTATRRRRGRRRAAAPQQPARKLEAAAQGARFVKPRVARPDARRLRRAEPLRASPRCRMSSLVQAALLGVLQGVTEFLPVSSTAHLLIGGRLLGFDDPGGVFTVMIQLGSILAVMWLYRDEDRRGRRRAAVAIPRRGVSR